MANLHVALFIVFVRLQCRGVCRGFGVILAAWVQLKGRESANQAVRAFKAVNV